MKDITDIFPLKIEQYTHDYGMGERDTRYCLKCNNGDIICHSDFKPNNIDDINKIINNIMF